MSLESTEMDSNSAENPPPPPPPPPPSSDARRRSLSDKPDTTKRRVPIHLRASTSSTSCHHTCKFGGHHHFEEKTRDSFQKRNLISSPNKAENNKQKEEVLAEKVVMAPLKIGTSRSSPNEVKPVKMALPGEKKQQQHSPRLPLSRDKPPSPRLSVLPRDKPPSPRLTILPRDKSPLPRLSILPRAKTPPPRLSILPRAKTPPPRLSILPRDKTPSRNQSFGKKSSHILHPSEKVEVLVKEGSISTDNKMSRADKRTSDQSGKPRSISADSKMSRVYKKTSDQSMKPGSISADNKMLRVDKKLSDQSINPGSIFADNKMSRVDKKTSDQSVRPSSISPGNKMSRVDKKTSDQSVRPGSISPGNKMSRADKKTSDQSVKPSSPIKVKPPIASGTLGKKMTSSNSFSDARLSPRFYPGKTEPSKPKEGGMAKFPLPSVSAERVTLIPKARIGGRVKPSSPPSRLKGTELEQDNEDSKESLHVIKTEAENSIPLSLVKGTELERDNEDSKETLHVIKTEAEKSIASPSLEIPFSAKTPSVSSLEENEEIQITVSIETGYMQTMEENHVMPIETGDIQTMEDNHTHVTSPSVSSLEESEEIQNTVSIETVYMQIMEENRVMPIETEDIQTMEDNHTHVTSPSPSPHEAEAGLILEKTDENHPQEMENSQLPDEIQNWSSSSSFHEVDDVEEIYPLSCSESSSHAMSSSSSHDLQIIADVPVSDRAKSVETKKAQRRTSLKNRLIHSDDKSHMPVKLKFRRGKVIDLQPENNVPKRIKFRRVRNMSLDSDRSLVKTRFSLGRTHSSASSEYSKYRSRREKSVHIPNLRKNIVRSRVKGDSEGVSRKVVLKHSKVEKKNDERVLLNNVIEETASKLVEKRISKVKALVGAFETVISLQETNTSPNSHARG